MADLPFEVYEGAKWIEATLTEDAEMQGMINGAFMDLVPQDIKLPAIRYHVQGSQQVRGVGPGPESRIMTRIEWLIVVMRENHGIAPLVPIVMRLDTLLEGASGETDLARIQSCVMLEPFQILETDQSGVQIRHAGGIYRTLVTTK